MPKASRAKDRASHRRPPHEEFTQKLHSLEEKLASPTRNKAVREQLKQERDGIIARASIPQLKMYVNSHVAPDDQWQRLYELLKEQTVLLAGRGLA